MLRWPDEQVRRDELATRGHARLLVLEFGASPPVSSDPLEDWARCSDSDLDVQARIVGLRKRMERAGAMIPRIDDNIIRFDDRWVALPPIETRLADLLVQRFGAVVARADLIAVGWPQTPPHRNALDVHVLRLRRRLEPLRLGIRTVRSRGYALESVATST